MKTLAEYLVESRQTYDYRIKFAGDVDADFLAKFKKQLEQFDVIKMSQPKTTPVKKELLDFPKFPNESETFIDVSFNYPAIPPQIVQMVQLLGFDPNRVVMQDRKYAEKLDQERDTQEKESKNLLTDTNYPAPNREQQEQSADYGADPYGHAVLKNAYRSDFTVAGGKTPKAKTTNDYPMGDTSPVGTKQNKIPTPKSFAR